MINKKIKPSNTFLGKDSEFEGDMKFFGTITIEGSFKGSISGEGTIIVGRKGELKSDIHASDIVVYGTIYGQVSAENKICIYGSGRIFGKIEAPEIQIEKGAIIKGKCNTQKPDKDDEEILLLTNPIK